MESGVNKTQSGGFTGRNILSKVQFVALLEKS